MGDTKPETHAFFGHEIASERKAMFKILLPSFALIIISVWALLSIFWGSNYRLEYYFYRIAIDIYDFDSLATTNPLLGPDVVQGLIKSMEMPTHFTFRVLNATGVTYEMIENSIVNEGAWAAVVINSNATSSFLASLNDSAPYSPNSISIVVASARFYQVILEYILPFLSQLLATPLLEASQKAVSTFLSSSTTTPALLGNLSANQLMAVGAPFGVQNYDVRPIASGQWSGSAPLEAGLIYFVIFAFHVTIFMNFARSGFTTAVKTKNISLPLKDVILMRFVPITIAYFFLSLWYSLINVAFSVPMNGNGHTGLNSQAGFMVFWMLNWITMASLGTAMEAMITLLTIKFFPLFLITWIILNITSSFFPPILMEYFYRFGYAMPFYHSTTADKFIFWGARNRLGLNFGVLIAWTVLSICTTILFEIGWRRVTHKQQGKEREEAATKGQEEVQKKKAEALKERDENVDLVIPE